MRCFPLIFTITIGGCHVAAAGPVVTTVQECLSEAVLSSASACSSGGASAHSTTSYSFSYSILGTSADVRADAWGGPNGLPAPPGNAGAYASISLSVTLYSAGPERPGILDYTFSEYTEDFGASFIDVGFEPVVESSVSVEGVPLARNNPPYGGMDSVPFLLGVPFNVTLTAIASGGCQQQRCDEWTAHPSLTVRLYDPGLASYVAAVPVPEPDYGGLLAILAAPAMGRLLYRRRSAAARPPRRFTAPRSAP